MIHVRRVMIIFAGAALFFSGCGGPRVDLVRTGKVRFETEPGNRVKILNAYVYQDGEKTVVTAAIRRRVFSSQPLKLNVIVSVIAPDGSEYLGPEKEVFAVPRYHPGKTRNITYYRKRFPEILPDGSVVRLVCQ